MLDSKDAALGSIEFAFADAMIPANNKRYLPVIVPVDLSKKTAASTSQGASGKTR